MRSNSPYKSGNSPFRQGNHIPNPFADLEEAWEARRPTILSRFDLHQNLVNVQKQNQQISDEIQKQKEKIEKDKWYLSQQQKALT